MLQRALSSVLTLAACVLALALLNVSVVHADVDFYRLFKTDGYQQTSNAQPATLDFATGTVDILYSNDADFDTAQVTSASPLSPMTLSPSFSGIVDYGQFYATAPARDVDFPNNTTYEYGISGGTLGTQSASLTTPATDLFASQIPFFNGTTFDQLQGMDSASSFQFNYDGYDAPIGSTTPWSFFAIIRVSDGAVIYNDSGPNTQTAFVLPANTLQPGMDYIADLVYSSRVDALGAGFNGATSEVGFDLRTDLRFTTAVPEPGTLGLLGIGGFGLIAFGCRRRASGRNSQP